MITLESREPAIELSQLGGVTAAIEITEVSIDQAGNLIATESRTTLALSAPSVLRLQQPRTLVLHGGPSGPQGVTGADGRSAYQVALDSGFLGSEAAWLASLVGDAGPTGPTGAAGNNGTNGADGADGIDGLSAYEIAIAEGFVGDQPAWLASLVGATGAAGNNGANGADGADGADGSSSYEIAVAEGFVGDRAAWLASLIGATGATGTTGATGATGATGPAGPLVPHNDLEGRSTADAHPISAITGLQSALDGKAATSHSHAISAITGLQTALDGKAATSHSHSAATGVANGFMSAADKTKLDGIATSANNYVHPNHTGDVTSVADGATTIASNAVNNAKLADMAAMRIKGRRNIGTGDPEDLTVAEVKSILNYTIADMAEVGVVGAVFIGLPTPAAPPVGQTHFYDGNGALGLVYSVAQQDALLGDLAYEDAVAEAEILNNAVTNAKMADMAQSTIKGRAAASGTGDPQDLTADNVFTLLGISSAGKEIAQNSVLTGAANQKFMIWDDTQVGLIDSVYSGSSFGQLAASNVWTGALNTFGELVVGASDAGGTSTARVLGSGFFGGSASAHASSVYTGVRLGADVNTDPYVAWIRSAGGADAKVWDVLVNSNDWYVRMVNDAYDTAVAAIRLTRSGMGLASMVVGVDPGGSEFLRVGGSARFSQYIESASRMIAVATNNDFFGSFEARGNGVANTLFPNVSFHQPGLYASSIQLRANADFRFYGQGGVDLARISAGELVIGATALVASERLRVSGGSAPGVAPAGSFLVGDGVTRQGGYAQASYFVSTVTTDGATTGTINDLNPVTNGTINFTAAGTITLNGIIAGIQGRRLTIAAGSAMTVTINQENGSASANDRLRLRGSASITLNNGAYTFEYVGARWLLV